MVVCYFAWFFGVCASVCRFCLLAWYYVLFALFLFVWVMLVGYFLCFDFVGFAWFICFWLVLDCVFDFEVGFYVFWELGLVTFIVVWLFRLTWLFWFDILAVVLVWFVYYCLLFELVWVCWFGCFAVLVLCLVVCLGFVAFCLGLVFVGLICICYFSLDLVFIVIITLVCLLCYWFY